MCMHCCYTPWLTGILLVSEISFTVPISSKFLFSYLILYITQWTSAKEKFDLSKIESFLEVLKMFKFAVILVHRSHQSSLRFEWVVMQIKEHVTWDLTYLACSYKMLERSMNRIFRFLNFHKKIAFYSNWKNFSQKVIAWNVGSDDKS